MAYPNCSIEMPKANQLLFGNMFMMFSKKMEFQFSLLRNIIYGTA